MASRRKRLGEFAQMLLQQHQQRRFAEYQSSLIADRQRELAELNDQLRAKQAADRFREQLVGRVVQDPAMADRLAGEGVQDLAGVPMSAFRKSDQERTAPLLEEVGKADSFEKLGDKNVLFERRRQAGPITNLTDIAGLLTAHDNQRQRITDTNTFNDDRAGAQEFTKVYQQGMGEETATAANHPAQMGRKAADLGQANEFRLNLERGLNPIYANRAGAETRARLNAELAPDIVQRKLDFESQKAAIEAEAAGNRQRVQLIATKKMAVEGLQPTYQKYRQLAIDVVNSPAAATLESAAGTVNTLSKVPFVGEMLGAGMEAGHAFATGLAYPVTRDPELSRKVSELNRLTDTLAQGMANAVLGNRGQTTENDRRTAKNILVNSFTTAKTAAELLKITDQMFALLPVVAADMPDAAPADIIQQAAERARSGQTPASAAQPVSQPATTQDNVLNDAMRIFNAR